MADPRPLIAACCAVGALLLLGWQISNSLRTDDPLSLQREHWVAEDTLVFVRRTAREVPPIRVGDQTLVIARCFQGDDGVVIGWLERYPEAVQLRLGAELAKPDPDPAILISAALDREVRAPHAGAAWFAARSRDGMAITKVPHRRDGSLCLPALPEPE
jgi:hypothetical protein